MEYIKTLSNKASNAIWIVVIASILVLLALLFNIEYIGILVSRVPNVIWAAVIASILTFLGVLLTNRGNRKSLSMQLEHDKYKFSYEQEVLLKKEVFIEAAANFSKSLSVIPKFSNLDVAMESINDDIGSYGPSAAKLYVIAKKETVKNVASFSSELADVILGLYKTRAELDDSKKAIAIYQGMIDSSNLENERLLSIMKELNLHGHADPAKWKYLNESFEEQAKNIKETQDRIKDVEREMIPKHIEFSKLCLSEYARLSVLVSPIITSVRLELHTYEDGDEFSDIFKESMSRMQQSYENFIKSIVG